MRESRDLGERVSAGVRLGWKVGGGAQRQAAGNKWEGRRESAMTRGKVASREGHGVKGMSYGNLPGRV